MNVLEISELTVRYGVVTAVDRLSLSVGEGQIVGLVGPNGAGKTSSIDAACGFTTADGSVRLDGKEVGRLPAHKRARLGLGRTWQSLELFDDLTVADNLLVAGRAGTRRVAEARQLVGDALAAVEIARLADRYPTELSQGQRKLVGVARALAGGPRVVCMDEPAAGLDTRESRGLGVQLRALAASGLGILLVDHDMTLVLDVCDHVVVIDFGRRIAAGPPSSIRVDPVVLEAYLGVAARGDREDPRG